MLNLDVSTDKLADLKKLFNNANVHHRIVGKSSDGLTTTLKFNKKVDFDKAKEIIDGKVAIQATLKRSSPVSKVSIGDTTIDWCADQGDPSIVAGAVISGDAYYDTVNDGVVLTEDVDGEDGYLYWEKNYDYNKNVYIRATTYSGEGDGADGITIFMGSSSGTHSGSANNGAIAVYIDEYLSLIHI